MNDATCDVVVTDGPPELIGQQIQSSNVVDCLRWAQNLATSSGGMIVFVFHTSTETQLTFSLERIGNTNQFEIIDPAEQHERRGID